MNSEQIKEILNKIDKKELEKFLIMILNMDSSIMNSFRSMFIKYFPSISKKEYKDKISRAIKEAGGRDNYIDYTETGNYTYAMYTFINESENLFNSKNYDSSFDIIEVILDSIPDTDIDDSDGSISDVSDDCIDRIKILLNTGDENIIDRIFDYVLSEVKTGKLYNYGIELYKLLEWFIKENKFIDEINETIKSYLEVHDSESWLSKEYTKILNEYNL